MSKPFRIMSDLKTCRDIVKILINALENFRSDAVPRIADPRPCAWSLTQRSRMYKARREEVMQLTDTIIKFIDPEKVTRGVRRS